MDNPHPAFQGAAIPLRVVVYRRTQELSEQIAVAGVQFDAVDTSPPGALGPLDKPLGPVTTPRPWREAALRRILT
jgi:hypothetical protein